MSLEQSVIQFCCCPEAKVYKGDHSSKCILIHFNYRCGKNVPFFQNASSVGHQGAISTSYDGSGRYGKYCKSTNFGVLLYLVNLANCVFSLF